MPTQTHTGVRDLLRNDVSRALFHLVREHLEERGSRPGRYGKLVIKQASEAAYIGVRRLNGGATKTELARHLGCSEPPSIAAAGCSPRRCGRARIDDCLELRDGAGRASRSTPTFTCCRATVRSR
jgi:hypothetical protein